MAIIVIAGGAEGELSAHLLRCLLESHPRTRVGMITPEGVFWKERRTPPEEGGVPTALEELERAGCTHAILLADGETLRRCAGLRPGIVALTAPVQGAEMALSSADMTVLDLDERTLREGYASTGGRIFTYSERRPEADLVARDLRLFPGHMEFEAVTVGQIRRIHLPVPGGFALYHCLCAISCGLCLGLSLEEMARVLRCVRGPQGQLEVLPIPAAYTVVLDRADTPETLERLLACVREFTARHLVCVLRCPALCAPERAFTVGGVAGRMADRIVLTADAGTARAVRAGAALWDRACTWEPDRRDAVSHALESAGPGDVIVLAGYRSESGNADERELVHACVRRRLRRGSGP